MHFQVQSHTVPGVQIVSGGGTGFGVSLEGAGGYFVVSLSLGVSFGGLSYPELTPPGKARAKEVKEKRTARVLVRRILKIG